MEKREYILPAFEIILLAKENVITDSGMGAWDMPVIPDNNSYKRGVWD